LLVDKKEESVRVGLRALLNTPEWEICGEAIDGMEGVEKTKALKPNTVGEPNVSIKLGPNPFPTHTTATLLGDPT